MAGTKTMIERAYAAFNGRDIDGALALMTEDVSWPKAAEGVKIIGKEEVRTTGLDNGVRSIPMSNRSRSPRKREVGSA